MMNYRSNADIVKQSLTMQEVAVFYGFKIQRGNVMPCPLHSEKTASCHVYEHSFYCFGCGVGGDVIKFVQLYFNLDFMQAMAKLNADFGLGLNLTGQADRKAVSQHIIRRKNEEAFKKWLNYALDCVNVYHRFLWHERKHPESPYFHEALNELEKLEYYFDCLIINPEDFFKTNREAVKVIDGRLERICRDLRREQYTG